MIRLYLSALVICVLQIHTATAEVPLRPEDAARLSGFETAAGDALLQALAGGAPGDVAQLATALSGTPQIAIDPSLQGDWTCRTLKLGGGLPLVVYSPFACDFTLERDRVLFEKRSGSQRTKGEITLRNGIAVYVGVGFVAGEAPPEYQDLPPDFHSDGRVQTDIAIFERVSPTRARLMFPSPAVESDFDILELTR